MSSENALIDAPVSRPQYAPLHASDQSIRLLQILPSICRSSSLCCELTTASLLSDPAPSYDALSYVWGPPEFASTITVNGQKCNITQSLETVLRRLRRRRHIRVLWVDQVCINQDDLAERSSQVSLMRTIYRAAQTVFAWLGDPPSSASDFEPAMRWLQHWVVGMHRNVSYTALLLSSPSCSFMDSTRIRFKVTYAATRMIPLVRMRQGRAIMELETAQELEGALSGFANIPYWSRLWILQEFALSQRAPVLVLGEDLVMSDKFLEAALWVEMNAAFKQRAMDTMKKYLETEDDDEHISATRGFEEFPWGFTTGCATCNLVPKAEMAWYIRARENLATDELLLSSLLRDTSGLSSKDPRDQLYGLYGLVPERYKLPTPDYAAPLDKVLREVMICLITTEKSPRIYDWLSPSPPESLWCSWLPNIFDETDRAFNARCYRQREERFAPRHGARASGRGPHVPPSLDSTGQYLTVQGWTVDEISFAPDLSMLQWHWSSRNDDLAWRCACEASLAMEKVIARHGDIALQDKPSKLRDALGTYKLVVDTLDPGRDPRMDGNGTKSIARIVNEFLESPDAEGEMEWNVGSAQSTAKELEDFILFCTEKGYMGFVFGGCMIKPKDVVIIIAGCDFPYVLRREEEDKWVMIGSAFVSGIMDGEFVEQLRGDDAPTESFQIV